MYTTQAFGVNGSAVGNRILGGIIGAVVSALAAGLGVWLGSMSVSGIAVYGIPIGALVGFAMAPRVLESKSPWRPALISAEVAVVVAIAAIASWSLIEMTRNSSAVGVLLATPYITFFAFLFGMPITLPVGLVSAVLLRRIATRRRHGEEPIGGQAPWAAENRFR